jgi:ethanolamine utilization protein EutA (predicted chaperonin)
MRLGLSFSGVHIPKFKLLLEQIVEHSNIFFAPPHKGNGIRNNPDLPVELVD